MDFESLVLITIPLVAWLLIRRFLHSFLCSCFVGVPLLWLSMIRHEMRAPVSDTGLMFVMHMVYWGTLVVGFYAMVVTTTWALDAIWCGGDGTVGERRDSGRQRGAAFWAAIGAPCFSVAVAAGMGGDLGGLAMMAIYGITTLVIAVKTDAMRAWAFASITPPLVPFGLLGIALMLTTFLRFELAMLGWWKEILAAFFIASVMASGPLGIIVSLVAYWNFPRDEDWFYWALLASAAAVQWFAVFRIGRGYLYRAPRPRTALLVCLAAASSICVLAFWLHLLVIMAKGM